MKSRREFRLAILSASVGLVLASIIGAPRLALAQLKFPDQTPVLNFFGATPGKTTVAQLLANPRWGKPTNKVPTGEGLTRFEFNLGKYQVWATSDHKSIVKSIDVALPAGAKVDQIVRGFKLGEPLSASKLPAEAEMGVRPEAGWRSQLYTGGRVVLFLLGEGTEQTVARIRFFGLPKPVLKPSITNTQGMRLTLVPAGEFTMGSKKSEADLKRAFSAKVKNRDEWPQHFVQITRPFYMGLHEVTQRQFRNFVEETGYRTDAERGRAGEQATTNEPNRLAQFGGETWQRNTANSSDGAEPVIYVSWNDAVAFCEWLSKKEKATYRLPTEAEWEYACRAGSTSLYAFGDNPEWLIYVGNTLDAVAREQFTNWTLGVRGRDGYARLAPVGKFRPNQFGLFDMHGNVWEWVSDWHDAAYYARSPKADPTGPTQGKKHVYRGGCWY